MLFIGPSRCYENVNEEKYQMNNMYVDVMYDTSELTNIQNRIILFDYIGWHVHTYSL